MFVGGEHAWIGRRFGTEGLETIEQNSLSFRFPLSWLASQRMRTTGQSIHILPFGGSNHSGQSGRRVSEDGLDRSQSHSGPGSTIAWDVCLRIKSDRSGVNPFNCGLVDSSTGYALV